MVDLFVFSFGSLKINSLLVLVLEMGAIGLDNDDGKLNLGADSTSDLFPFKNG